MYFTRSRVVSSMYLTSTSRNCTFYDIFLLQPTHVIHPEVGARSIRIDKQFWDATTRHEKRLYTEKSRCVAAFFHTAGIDENNNVQGDEKPIDPRTETMASPET